MATRVSELGNPPAISGLGTYSDLDDRMLVLDFQAGNTDAYSEIHRRYAGLAKHVCQRILRNAEDADEATQEAMLRVYQGLHRFNGRYALQPWVARIATNVSLDITRARARRPRESERAISELHEELHEHSADPLELVVRSLDRERIYEALDHMPERHRDALVLRELEGRSHKEIGEALGVTPSQAKALIHRAKASFRRAWDGVKVGVLVPLFVAPFKGRGLLGRLLQPAQELAAASTAAPAVTAPLVTTGERITAAALAVMVAGTAAVGAVTLKHEPRKARPAVSPSAQVAAPATDPSPIPAPPMRTQQTDRDPKAKLVQPAASRSPAASETPSASPTDWPSPTETETPSPAPTIGPAPPWTIALESSVPIGRWQPELVSPAKVVGKAGRRVGFSGETVSGPTVTRRGVPKGWLSVEYYGAAQGADGNATVSITLDTSEGHFRYQATGSLANVEETEDGVVEYTFTGTYAPIDWPSAEDGSALLTEDVPHDGTFQLDLRFWADGSTLYGVGLALQDAAP